MAVIQPLMASNSSIEVCSSYEIRELNERKRYTLAATELINAVITDSKLTAAAAKLWQFLYSHASLDPSLKTNFTYERLAEAFGKSIRTIMRYIKDLREKGYLRVEANFTYMGQQANTFYVRFPKAVIQEIQQTKDRAKLVIFPPNTGGEITSQEMTRPLGNKSAVQAEDRLCEHLKIGEKESWEAANSVTPRGDRIGIHNTKDLLLDINNKITNNNVVVNLNGKEEKDDDSQSKQYSDLKAMLKQRQQQLNEIRNQYTALCQNNRSRDAIHKVYDQKRALDAKMSSLELAILQIEDKLKRAEQGGPSPSAQVSSPIDYANVSGKRAVSEFDVKRLKKGLVELKLTSHDIARLTNEIVFAARFGSLQMSKDSGREISLQHSINIALKLVREGRWETPVACL